jgi:hypothetical protein
LNFSRNMADHAEIRLKKPGVAEHSVVEYSVTAE